MAASSDELMTLSPEDLPAIFRAADQSSLEAQSKFLRRSAVGLIMVVLAAGAGGLIGRYAGLLDGRTDPMGVIAAAAFAIAMLVRISLLADRPEGAWYEGRALAESAKTLAWRYSVGGAPFEIERSADEVDLALTKRLEDILIGLDAASLAPPSGQERQITPKMRALRAGTLEERKDAYTIGRIEDQLQWYSRKARTNRQRFERWNLGLISLEAFGLLGAILTAANILHIDLLGFTGAVVAAGASWLQAKQYSSLAEAYSVAAHELAAISDRIPLQRTEVNWAKFVSESEVAISREHTLWRASRTMK
jgi:SMODS and SLOG-associating 2TM effector domain 3/SMODS and SLOG-associating 2TM effector domain 1